MYVSVAFIACITILKILTYHLSLNVKSMDQKFIIIKSYISTCLQFEVSFYYSYSLL